MDGDRLVVHSGRALTAYTALDTLSWHDAKAGASHVLHAGPLGDDRRPCLLFLAGTRTLAVIDVRDGRRLWSWSAPPETFISPAGVCLLDSESPHRCVCFPTYGEFGICFDLSDPEHPVVIWKQDCRARWDRGFGPNVIALPSRNGNQILTASRVGKVYQRDPSSGRVTTAEIVLGRSDGQLYQAVVDADTGLTEAELRWRPDPSGYPYSRPYGLLTSYEADDATVIVLASCQVEEFIAVTELRDGELLPLWAEFIERDWPRDEMELRPQTSSLRCVDGDGAPELVVGRWDGIRWKTLILDPSAGPAHPKRVLEGRYLWGVVTAAGTDEIVVTSLEPQRTPRCRSGLIFTDLARGTEHVVPDVKPMTTDRDQLDAFTAFMADRRSLVAFRDRSATRVAVIPDDGLGRIAGVDIVTGTIVTVDERPARSAFSAGPLVLADAAGRIWRRGAERAARPPGGSPVALCWTPVSTAPEIVVETAGERTSGFDPRDGRDLWTVQGRMPVLAATGLDAHVAVAVARPDGSDDIVVYRRGGEGITESWRAYLGGSATVALVALGAPLTVAATVRTGSHTSRLVVVRADGSRWETDGGAHPAAPSFWPRRDGLWLLADDHGVLRAYDETGAVVLEHLWNAAYSTPIPVPELDAVLRANSTHGCALVRADGSLAWRADVGLWRSFPGCTALLGLPGRTWGFATLGADGALTVRGISSGHVIARRRIPVLFPSALAAADIDGDGAAEIVVGDAEGRVQCLGIEDGRLSTRWTLCFAAAICHCAVADIDADGQLDLVVSTADGVIHICR